MSVLVQCRKNCILSWFDDAVFGIVGKLWSYDAGQLPAGPRAPAALFAPWFIHPVGQVLEMHPRIPNKNVRRRVPQKPAHGGIGQGPLLQHWFGSLQVCPETTVQLEHRSRHQPALPEILSVGECGEIKFFIAVLPMLRERAGVHRSGGDG